ncbi:ISAs1 family transposase [Escherichia coli]
MEHISIIPDYRQAWKVEHKLSDILLLTICAVISGAESWEDIEDFGETHLDFLKQYGDFENGIPVHDTIARVVSCISPAKFHECFINWMRDCHSSDDKDVIAIDGKTLRHSYDKSRRRGAIHVISAFSTMHSLVIGQIRTMEHISIIPDYRQAWKVEHKLSDILLLTICAVISGAESWEDIEDFGETHLDFLKQYGDFENGIPVHDTIARVVSCISPAKFHECFINWMRDCHSSDDKDVIAIDGKTLRHSYDKSRRRGAIHVISAFSTMHSLVIGQIETDEKSNEITAIPELLNMLDIKGKIITTDAMGCQKDIAEKIQKQGGDYLFAVKGNQGRLNKAFEEKFPLKELNNPEHDSYAISEKSHGREEIRLHIVCDVLDELIDFTFEWKGLKKLCVAVSFRSIIAEQKKEPEMTVRYYISSADLTAEKFATAIRNHWHVENKLHWRLDVVMNEDDCKIRRGNAAELFSGIRHIAINILTNDKVFKAGLRRKMRKAAMDRNYLASVLAGSGLS